MFCAFVCSIVFLHGDLALLDVPEGFSDDFPSCCALIVHAVLIGIVTIFPDALGMNSCSAKWIMLLIFFQVMISFVICQMLNLNYT
jgi:hypothetical protein